MSTDNALAVLTATDEQTPVVAKLNTEKAAALYTAKNTNPSVSTNRWSFPDEVAKQANEGGLDKALNRLAKMTELGEEGEIKAAIDEVRKFQRKNLVFMGFVEVDEVDQTTHQPTGNKRDAIKFSDPYTGSTFTMGQTIAISKFREINTVIAEALKEQGEELPEDGIAIKGGRFDITYMGKVKNTSNDRSSHQFDVQLSSPE